MNEFSYINFNQFSKSQICDLIVGRIYRSINGYIESIYSAIADDLFSQKIEHTAFNNVFLILIEEIKQLMRMEEKILFQYVKSVHASPMASDQIVVQRQQQILQLMLESRIAFHQLLANNKTSAAKRMIENDLFQLESSIKEWFLSVDQKVLHS